MADLNPYTGVPYERTISTDHDKFIEHPKAHVDHFKALWDDKPLKDKFFIATCRWSFPTWPKLKKPIIRALNKDYQQAVSNMWIAKYWLREAKRMRGADGYQNCHIAEAMAKAKAYRVIAQYFLNKEKAGI